MIDRQLLLADLKKQVKLLETDLRDQVTAVPTVFERLDAEYQRAFKLGRTAATWAAWRDERVTQAAAAWVLGTVFVRFCEDNGLLEQAYLAGPTVERMTHAEEAQEDFFRLKPAETDRAWILEAFDAIGSAQAGKLLFDERHNAAYQIPVSADAAKALIGFWRQRGEDGVLIHDFTDPEWDTRFLGDLYQDLSESARKTYALLQTPEFVEEFILDLTLTPAIEEFGYDVVKVIDPTCGSGHFLLGAFHRLLREWERAGKEPYEQVRLTLDAIHGVDMNPFAAAIARFRLIISGLQSAGFDSFQQAAQHTLPVHIAIGDSLLKDHQEDGTSHFFEEEDAATFFHYATEDLEDHPGILEEGKYHVVVGNPPYITASDEKANQNYRRMYSACHRQYALTVPFAQRFFELAMNPRPDGRGAGFVGQITSNSFMKREFGRKLIQEFFALRTELTHIIDTSGAYIPGHGTPTVILIGHPRVGSARSAIRTILGIRGEPTAPAVPAEGHVWRAIMEQINLPDSHSEWVSSIDAERRVFSAFPWSLSGGGADRLLQTLNGHERTLAQASEGIGRTTHTGLDDAYYLPSESVATLGFTIPSVPVVLGEHVRDYTITTDTTTMFPYSASGSTRPIDIKEQRFYWRNRILLQNRIDFGQTPEQRGLRWFDHSMFFAKRFTAPATIPFAFVATHNHFVLDRGGKVFNRSAPVIKLPDGASEEEHLRLLGVLNSSTACFWLKQVSHDKGGQSGTGGFTTDEWERFFEFTGTKLQEFPLPSEYPTELATRLDAYAQRLAALSPATIATDEVPTRERLTEARDEWQLTRAHTISLQEELDWQVYSLYGLLEDLRAPAGSVPELQLGERAFEIVLARRVAAGEAETLWFTRHGSMPITELPSHWSAEYRTVVERRIAVIESNRSIGLIERPECKRRWHLAIGNRSWTWADQEEAALRNWLLDRCEASELWFHSVDGMEQPRPLTASQLADELRRDADVLAVAELYAPGKDFAKVVAELITDEHVPYLAALRYKDSGLDKHADWEAVWELQRAEDAAPDERAKKKIRDAIPVPPKYGSGDFLKSSYWRNRGKLDVPKERFISYPLASPDGDPSLLLGWAGWDHRERAQALATLIVEREQAEGWSADRLTPLLAGLREVLPWVRQWHGDFDPLYGGSPAELYEGFLSEVTGRLHVTDQAMTGWRPPKATRGRRPASAT
ncbi:BREX-2 system adenine-specific DNA-methyltransferase PglX [Dactylosporangium siamense]|uniref:site-specific DNA-methyltransferase (adenine-specific) n=1 Tax=Dactylosporangium siamense TaxID=685454 RepID=A0A919PHK1_9ACTN|nr:BREX-2 system adenine-specific DNA-methyltransferase PglX [Dactylosporangium siamense]GIG44956.1 DNA methylase [Dactylosporangium siamense]